MFWYSLRENLLVYFMQINKYDTDNPLTFTGTVEFIGGNRIIQGDKVIACYHKDGSVYVAERLNSKPDEDIMWYERWFGQKYINNLLVYVGPFKYYYYHTEEGQFGTEYTYNPLKQLKSKYVGGFKFNSKHGIQGTLIDEKMRYTGKWQRGYRQGQFFVYAGENITSSIQIKDNSQGEICYFFNDVPVGSQPPDASFSIAEKEGFPVGLSRYGVTITESLTKSLKQNEWLTSTAVDLFMNHLEKSYNQAERIKREVKFFKVSIFQSLIDSGMIESNKQEKLNYKVLESFGLPYKNIISIFVKYPLIIMPFNINMSHFSISFIITKTEYEKGELKRVEFQLGHLDPLAPQRHFIFSILKRYILAEIDNNIHPAERNIYLQALKKALTKESHSLIFSANLKFTHQKNSSDCGVFTCMFAFLLAASYGLKLTVDWQFPDEHIPKLRKIIEKDAWHGVPNLLELLIRKFTKQK